MLALRSRRTVLELASMASRAEVERWVGSWEGWLGRWKEEGRGAARRGAGEVER